MAHAEGRFTKALGHHSHSEGIGSEENYVIAAGNGSHAEGGATIAKGDYSHAEGQDSYANGLTSHVEGLQCQANGDYSHAEGSHTVASNYNAHAEGYNTQANGGSAHAEGGATIAKGDYSHAEGQDSYANGLTSHAEGLRCQANGDYSHAEGVDTMANAEHSHSEGTATQALGKASHAEGVGTHAVGDYQHVQGRYNIPDVKNGEYLNGKYAHIVGNGDIDNPSNAHTLDWDGNAWFAGNVTIGDNNEKLVTESVLNTKADKTIVTIVPNLVTNGGLTFKDFHNRTYHYLANAMSYMNFYFDNDVYEEDYTCELSFNSGETPTTITYTNSGILNWLGTDCSIIDGYSVFKPTANKHYDIIFYFNGTCFVGMVNGFTMIQPGYNNQDYNNPSNNEV
jgi:hypothetical protein